MTTDDIQLAEKLTRRRARASILIGVFFMLSHAGSIGTDPLTRPGHLAFGAWIIWAALLLLILTTGGSLFRKASVRSLVNDEGSKDHLARAQSLGFMVMGVLGILTYIVSFYEPLSAREAIRIILTFSLGIAMIRFGRLEQRALRGD
jgi:uncharacterized membrane protein